MCMKRDVVANFCALGKRDEEAEGKEKDGK